MSRAAATGRRRLAKDAPKRIRLACRGADAGLRIGWPVSSRAGNGVLRGAADRAEQDEG